MEWGEDVKSWKRRGSENNPAAKNDLTAGKCHTKTTSRYLKASSSKKATVYGSLMLRVLSSRRNRFSLLCFQS